MSYSEPLLTGWTIFDVATLEFPGWYVVRRWELFRGGILTHRTPACLSSTLADARAGLPPDLLRCPSHPSDGPNLVESWIPRTKLTDPNV